MTFLGCLRTALELLQISRTFPGLSGLISGKFWDVLGSVPRTFRRNSDDLLEEISGKNEETSTKFPGKLHEQFANFLPSIVCLGDGS